MKQLSIKKCIVFIPMMAFCVAQAQQLRVKAYAIYFYDANYNDFFLFDSTSYSYQGTRLSNFDGDGVVNGYGADQFSDWVYGSAPNQYDEQDRNFNNYDNNGNLLQYLMIRTNGSTWDSIAKTDYTHNSQNRVASLTRYLWASSLNSWYPSNYGGKELRNYDSQNNLTEKIIQNWDAANSTWLNDGRVTYQYTANQLTEETLYNWYNSAWSAYSNYQYFYTGSVLDSTLTQSYTGGQWKNSQITYYSYDTNNDPYEEVSYQWSSAANPLKEPFSKYLNVFDNNHNCISRIYQDYNNSNFENSSRERTTYNTANLRTYSIDDTWNNTTLQFEYADLDPKAFWYYEPNTTSVNETSAFDGMIKLYPNPATTSLHVSIETLPQKSLIGLSILDASGKLIKHWNEPVTAPFERTVDVADLPAGMYFLRINTGSTPMQKFSIIR